METVLYADVLFLVNFAMDFISLSSAASLGSRPKKTVRLCLSAALGSIYGIASTVSSLSGIPQYLLAIAVGASMCYLSFGGCGGIFPFLRQCFIFFGCGALLGGIMTAALSMGASPPKGNLIITAASALVVLYFIVGAIRHRVGCKFMTITITYGGNTTSFDALCDSGNLLRDPFSGLPVVVVSKNALGKLLPQNIIEALLSCNGEDLSREGVPLRLIPRKAQNNQGMLCALKPDKAVVTAGKRKTERPLLIAPTSHSINYYGGFSATAPSTLLP